MRHILVTQQLLQQALALVKRLVFRVLRSGRCRKDLSLDNPSGIAGQMSNQATLDDTVVRPCNRTRKRTKEKRQPPYAVVLHNDSINGFDHVVRVLKKVFGYGTTKAFWLTLKAHCTGRSHVWSGTLEVAELKADQLHPPLNVA